MRICPRCLYHDGPYWRPRHFDTMIDIARLEDVELMNPFLGQLLKDQGPRIVIYSDREVQRLVFHDFPEAFYAFRMTSGGMIWRKEVEFLRSEGWSVPSDGAGSKKSAAYKRAISKR